MFTQYNEYLWAGNGIQSAGVSQLPQRKPRGVIATGLKITRLVSMRYDESPNDRVVIV
jgi:hypothetical protein